MLLPEGELAELPSRWTSGMVRAPPIKQIASKNILTQVDCAGVCVPPPLALQTIPRHMLL